MVSYMSLLRTKWPHSVRFVADETEGVLDPYVLISAFAAIADTPHARQFARVASHRIPVHDYELYEAVRTALAHCTREDMKDEKYLRCEVCFESHVPIATVWGMASGTRAEAELTLDSKGKFSLAALVARACVPDLMARVAAYRIPNWSVQYQRSFATTTICPASMERVARAIPTLIS
jgi:hypothetical protein